MDRQGSHGLRILSFVIMTAVLASTTLFSLIPPGKITDICPKGFNTSYFFKLFPLLHFLGYMTLALCLLLIPGREKVYRIPAAIFIPLLLGGIIEILQGSCSIPGHTASWLDFSLNLLGIAAAVLIVWLLEKKQAK